MEFEQIKQVEEKLKGQLNKTFMQLLNTTIEEEEEEEIKECYCCSKVLEEDNTTEFCSKKCYKSYLEE